VLVNNMRLMAVLDWWEAAAHFLGQPPPPPADADLRVSHPPSVRARFLSFPFLARLVSSSSCHHAPFQLLLATIHVF
jgi:hypothetical protein